MEGPLKDLDVNVALRFDDLEVKQPAEKEPPMVCVLDALQSGQTWYAKTAPERPHISLEIDWFEFRAMADQVEQGIAAVSKSYKGTVLVLSALDSRVTDLLAGCSWLGLKLNRMVYHDQLSLISKFRLCDGSKSVCIAHPQPEALRRDLKDHLNLFEWHGINPFALSTLAPAEDPGLRGCAVIPPIAPPIATQELHLAKAHVTYLIGIEGTRIEATRQQSQATIKVLPLQHPARSTARSTGQTIAITGTPEQVACALTLLEAQLTLHQLAPSRLL